MIVTSTFAKLCRLKHKNKAVQGSQGAGKTYSILSRWILLALKSKKPQLCSIVTDTMPNLRKGAIKDFSNICLKNGVEVTGTKSPYVFKINNWAFEFFSIDKESKGLGGRRDRLFINEAIRIPWSTARQLIARTHGECIFDFNPSHSFWVHEQFVEVNDCDFLKVTYKDNEELPQGEVDSIEKHAPWGTNPDENYWRVYGLGEIGFVQGMILSGYKTFKELPDAEYQDSIGIDFGWEDPMTAVKVWVNHKEKQIYWKELFYASQAKEDDMVKTIMNHPDYNNDICACDHDPRGVLHLRGLGLSAMNANKKNGIIADIRTIKQYTLHIHEDSDNLIREANFWKYQEKQGQIIEYPDQSCSEHAIDAGRYGTTIIIRN
jgi:phage terminase large subunit